ncbi:MFS transporter [uncultured Duncaniella sp.]|uniref:MFS transporter n=1 Tax=uncultured Duncaniella sp. TaxID=2768039 RepID=UPI0025A9FAFE|nr:MFS transporter [uncultured Duncaniella sp.]
MQRGLIALAIGTFALGIAEFGMMGILSDVTRSVNVSVVDGGHLISAYSLGVAIGAPMLIFLRKMPLKRLLLLLAVIITAGNTMAALLTGFPMLLCARFLSGLPHGAFFGAGAIVCSRLASPGHGAQAVAVMVGGMTVANVAGVPAATLISNLFNWRIAFAMVALFGGLALVGIRAWIPRLEPLPDSGMKGQFRFLKSAAPWLIYAGVFFGQASVYCWFSYVDPIMTKVTGFTGSAMTWVMMLAGIGMVTGNAIAGKLADRFGVARVCGTLAASMLAVMPMLYLFADVKIASLALMFLATGALFGIGGPLQYLIVRFAKGGEMLGGAGIQIAFNVSNAVSAALGGIAIHHGFGLASPALVGVPFAAVGAAALFILRSKYKTQGA